MIGIVVVVPVVISYVQAHRLGVIWQARYIMPMPSVGLPLTCVALIEDTASFRLSVRLGTLVCGILGIGQFAAFAENLRRYTVGVSGSLNFFHSTWQPPLGAFPLTVLAFLLLVLLTAFC